MHGPGQHGADQEAEHQVGGDQAQQGLEAFGMGGVGQQGRHMRQGEQHQPQSDHSLGQVALTVGATETMQEYPCQDKDRRQGGDIERQDLHDQGRSDIGAEHDGQAGHQVERAGSREAGCDQPGRRTALQKRRNAQAGGKSRQTAFQALVQDNTDACAISIHDARLHHVQAP